MTDVMEKKGNCTKYSDISNTDIDVIYDNCFDDVSELNAKLNPPRGKRYNPKEVRGLAKEYSTVILEHYFNLKKDTVEINCLKCSKKFKSWSRKSNRLCSSCHSTNRGISNRSEYLMV